MSKIKQQIKAEYTKCMSDFVYASKRYGKITHPIRGKIPFHLYPFQEKTLSQLDKHRLNIILKARQMGISTLVAAYICLKMIFNDEWKAMVIATNQEVAKNLVSKVKLFHENLPSWLKRTKIDDNKLQLTLDNGSFVKAVSSAAHSGRSEALSLLVIDEAAFVQNIDDIWTASQLTLATGGGAIILSTPNGVGNLFHRLWEKAMAGEAPEGLEPFNPIELHWSLHPDRDQTWRDQQTYLLGEKEAAQECDCDFITSGHTVIDGELLQWYKSTHVKDPIEKRGMGGDFWIWEYPRDGKEYVVTVDVARGDGSDYSAIEVFDPISCEQVAEYVGHIDTRELGRLAVQTAIMYNRALLAIENKNIGWDTVQEALDLEYPNLYYTYKHDPFLDENIHLRKSFDLKQKKDMTPGFTTSTRTRPVMISKLDTYFRDKAIIIHSIRLINQLMVFKWINNKPQAATGYNDDLVIATSMYLFLRDTALKLRSMGIELNRKAMAATRKHIYKPSKGPSRHNTMPDGRGGNISTRWVL